MQVQDEAGSEDRSGMNALDKLIDALRRYFDLMYDCDIVNFADVFSPTAQLHGYREGQMVRRSLARIPRPPCGVVGT